MVLNGSTTKGNHLLSWTIKADEAIKNIVIEFSSNGVNFTPLPSLTGISNKFWYKPYQSTTVYYRLRVTSIINQTVYSDSISLKSTENSDASFKVSTLVQNDIRINAPENYQYKIIDINGRRLATGHGVKGLNTIDISNKANGIYILQLFAQSKNQVEKIIKN